jgi:uncharacterized protein YjdB
MKLENNMNRDDIVKVLSEGQANVTFTKKDGSVREMLCTRNMNEIPVESQPKGGSERKENLEVITAYDLDKSGWRSFRVDAVIDVKSSGAV